MKNTRTTVFVSDVTPHLLRVFLAAGRIFLSERRSVAALRPAGVAVSQRVSGTVAALPLTTVAHISSKARGAWTPDQQSPALKV